MQNLLTQILKEYILKERVSLTTQLNTLLLIYVVTKVTQLKVQVSDSVAKTKKAVVEVTGNAITSLNKTISSFEKVAETQNNMLELNANKVEALSRHLNKMEKSIAEMSKVFDLKTSMSNDMVTKLISTQQPAVTVVNESISKYVLIGSLVLLGLIALGGVYLAPKITLVSGKTFGMLNYTLSEILKHSPWAPTNTGTGVVTYTEAKVRITTEIINGLAQHMVTKLSAQGLSNKIPLEQYLLELAGAGLGSDSAMSKTIEVADIITKSGVNITCLV